MKDEPAPSKRCWTAATIRVAGAAPDAVHSARISGMEITDLFAFLTTAPNTEVGAIHPKAMPVIDVGAVAAVRADRPAEPDGGRLQDARSRSGATDAVQGRRLRARGGRGSGLTAAPRHAPVADCMLAALLS